MSQTYFTLLTNLGAQLLANATALGTQLKLTHMAVGDGNDSTPEPNANQKKLVREVRRAPVNTINIDDVNKNQIIVEQVIPESVGGWYIREIGLFDDKGNLIAVGNCPPTYKPVLSEGSARTQVIRMILIVNHANAVEINIDPSVVLSTRQYVDESILSHEKTTNHPNATTDQEGFTILSSATNSDAEDRAATSKAVKIAMDKANAAATTAANAQASANSGISAASTAQATASAAKTTAETDATTTQKGRVKLSSATDSISTALAATPLAVKNAMDKANAAAAEAANAKTSADGANNNANGRVPTERKINGKALTADITLNFSDFGAKSSVVETYISSDKRSWYRKYSDGFIEQCGYITNGTGVTINFLIPFSALPNIQVTGGSAYGDWPFSDISSLTNKSAFIGSRGTQSWSTKPVCWYASGY